MTPGFEREIKLRFADPAIARTAVVAAGATPKEGRRLQHDALVDTAGRMLRTARSMLRVRVEDGHAVLTFKGPVQPSTMKLREEIETTAADAPALLALLDRLGFRVWFRYEKFREEFALLGCIVAIDETPVGTFVEIEGDEDGIVGVAAALGRSPDDFLLDSYRDLHVRRCEAQGVAVSDMLFTPTPPASSR